MFHRLSGALRCAALLSFLLAATAVHAQATRTWVSGTGDDANPCNRTAPCKTFAGAISKTAAGGQISVLDPGGYGALSITKSLTIEGLGQGGSATVFGTNGISINIPDGAGVERVILRGLNIDGVGGGLDGVRVLSGASVLIEDVTIQNFTGDGIEVLPGAGSAAAHVVVRNSAIANTTTAVRADGTNADVTLELDGVVLAQGTDGVRALSGASVQARGVRASQFSGSAFAVIATSGPAALSMDGSAATASGTGVLASGAGAIATLAECSIAFNDVGIEVAGGGEVHSFGNNRVHGNLANDGPTAEIGGQ
jgi:hypothetical protein